MAKKKREVRRVIFIICFISIMLIGAIQFFSNSNLIEMDRANDENFVKLPYSSDLTVEDNILGNGDSQDVRIYVNNASENRNNNHDYFEIPSVTDDMYLSYGDFNFTFQNNYTTEYILEDSDALYASDFIAFDYDTSLSGYSRHSDTDLIDGDFNDLTDNSNSTYIRLNATKGILNFTIRANFTNTDYSSGGINGNIEFNRSQILGLISSLVLTLDSDANLTVRLKDYSQTTWKEVLSSVLFNSTLGRQRLKDHFINENLNFIDLTDSTYIQFIFTRNDLNPFEARLYEYDIQSTYAFDFPITSQNYVALEFDLKGDSSNVNGFYAWIRTLNLTEAATSKLNITLYRADDTIVRTENNLRNTMLNPDYSEMIDTQMVSYSSDDLSYFEFNTANTKDLNLSNYFVVIKSNNSKEVYSLVTIPYFDYGDPDGRTEHQLLMTVDSGTSWDFSKIVIDTDNPPNTYQNFNLDASSFKLNVTRGYMPSDFIYDNNQTLRIQDIPIDNLVIDSYPYNESSYLTWGKGRWNNIFTTIIEDSPSNVFQVPLSWNKSIVTDFSFNVSYSVKAYWFEKATTYYNAMYNKNPEWAFDFDFNDTDPNFNNWDFIEFWYVYPDFLSAHNLTNPNDEEFLWLLDADVSIEDRPNYLKLVVNESFSNLNGIYRLNLTSYNFIDKMHSYINYYDILWETNGFMYGDNISISVDIRDHKSKAPINGDINATLFYPNGTKYHELNSSAGIVDDTVLSYDFNNNTILDVTKDIPVLGEYELGFFWFNGSAIGCKKITLYIDSYDLELYNCTYLPNSGTNILSGELNNKVFQNYTILVASVNDTTGISNPGFYPINNTDVNQLYSYSFGKQELTLLVDSFLQSENILNPNEIVNFKTTVKNTHQFIPFDVKVNVKLVSYVNENLIIAETTSPTINLNFSGTSNDTYEFNIDLTIPNLDIITNTWEGYNAPIRLGGAKTLVTFYIDDTEVGVFESVDYSLLSNETSDNYEGYILGLKISEETTSRSLLYEFERDECIYYPNSTSFLVNIIDKNYVSSYIQYNDSFSLKLNSMFTNIQISPDVPITGEIINVSSILTTEFGEQLPSKNVTCEYHNSNSWIYIDSNLTNGDGFVVFSINTALLEFEESLKIRLIWEGDIVNGANKNITIEFIQQINNFSISIKQVDNTIYKRSSTTVKITIHNFGASNLRFSNISIKIDGDLSYSIVGINQIELNWLKPDESTEIIIKIKIPEIDSFEIEFAITAQNIITGENLTSSKNSSFKVFDPPLLDYFFEFFMFFMIIIIALIWVLTIFYGLRVRKKIEEPIEEVEQKPRKGRYLKVSELKKPATPKKAPKEKEAVEPKKTTDLDSLLEERGLAEKEKKKKSKK